MSASSDSEVPWLDGADDETTVIVDPSTIPPAEPIGEREPKLIVLEGPREGEVFSLSGKVAIGRAVEDGIRLPDARVSRKHAVLIEEDGVVTIEDLRSTNATLVNGQPTRRQKLRDGDRIQLGSATILKFTYQDRLETEFQQRMFESTVRDSLTGLVNRAHLWERLEAEVAYAVRHHTCVSLLLFDLDHFKRINDGYGHLAGDRVLQTVARRLVDAVRVEDLLARYGGEEFALLSRGIGPTGTRRLAERVRATIASRPVRHEGRTIRVTASVGAVRYPCPGVDDVASLVQAADEALYAAKRSGRDRVATFEEECAGQFGLWSGRGAFDARSTMTDRDPVEE